MSVVLLALRVIAFALVLGAVLDPGCARPTRPRLAVAAVGDATIGDRQRIARDIRAVAAWADVIETDARAGARLDVAVDGRVAVGDAAPLLAEVRDVPIDLVVRTRGPALEIGAVSVPPSVLAGSRVPLAVRVQGLAAVGGERIRVRVVDAATGAEQATTEHTLPSAGATNDAPVVVDWLATGEGPRRLRFRAEPTDEGNVRPSAWVDVDVRVRPATFRVHVLEARPTWAGRFARLALAASGDFALTTDVRTAPGLAVRRAPDRTPSNALAAADVVLVSGLDALTGRDVAALAEQVRIAGRTAVLLMDEPPAAGPWRQLWPADLGRVASAPEPERVSLAGATWRAREWLAAPTSTGVVPLAYVDKGRAPVVLARTLGEGRVVLVGALDAWRWRAAEDVTWDDGWHALVRRMAADVPDGVGITAWPTGSASDRVLHADVTLRADVVAAGPVQVDAHLAVDGAERPVALAEVQPHRRRGATRVERDAPHRVVVEARDSRGVVTRSEVVVHVSPGRRPATWSAVVHDQRTRGALAATEGAELREALGVLRSRLVRADGPRWWVTRTWWYAAIVIAALGSEWILRRARRLP